MPPTETEYKAKIDALVARVPFEHRLDFLNFVLEGTTSASFYRLLNETPELQGLLNEMITLVEESFSAVMEVVALDTFAKRMAKPRSLVS